MPYEYIITLKKKTAKENISQEFRLKNIDEIRNCFIEEINQNKMMTKRNKKFCTNLSYIKHLFILSSKVTA